MGRNDYHIEFDGATGQPVLLEGLGKDEPSEDLRVGVRAVAEAKLKALRAEVEQEGEALTERERELAQREQELERRERELAAREGRDAAAQRKVRT